MLASFDLLTTIYLSYWRQRLTHLMVDCTSCSNKETKTSLYKTPVHTISIQSMMASVCKSQNSLMDSGTSAR